MGKRSNLAIQTVPRARALSFKFHSPSFKSCTRHSLCPFQTQINELSKLEGRFVDILKRDRVLGRARLKLARFERERQTAFNLCEFNPTGKNEGQSSRIQSRDRNFDPPTGENEELFSEFHPKSSGKRAYIGKQSLQWQIYRK